MKPVFKSALAAAFGVFIAGGAQAACVGHLESGTGLWLEPQDTEAALLEPDCYAWQLFVALNWPADPATQAADPAKALGGDGPATWELWRNVRRGSQHAVFRIDGRDPGPWLTGAQIEVTRSESDFDPLPLQLAALLEEGALAEFDPGNTGGNEVRMNRESYDFVRDQTLFNIEGLGAVFDGGTELLSFPANAKEVKARWRVIGETDKPRYHWVDVMLADGNTVVFGLSALHITTKDLPNWFWATFEHIDNEKSELEGGLPGNPGWLAPSVDRYSCPEAPVGCRAPPEFVANTKWENYVLRGTQTDFTDSRGRPTILANSVIEAGFQATSSCISCHARASFDGAGRFLSIFKSQSPLVGDVGSPDPAWFFQNGTAPLIRTQSDFVWSLFRACSTASETSCM
jgi:hypothetical protein